ncbi:hypothetical protein SAMN04487880_0206 [Marinobacter sp. es.042]|nr:hypothetical protein SAMN04487880_0206 [Marinobacter sp. es.042]
MFYKNIGYGLRRGIPIRLEQRAYFRGTGLIDRVGIIFTPPDQKRDDKYKNSTDYKLHFHLQSEPCIWLTSFLF